MDVCRVVLGLRHATMSALLAAAPAVVFVRCRHAELQLESAALAQMCGRR